MLRYCALVSRADASSGFAIRTRIIQVRVGLGVDGLRLAREVGVHGDHFTGDRREQLRDGLHRLDRPEDLALRERPADGRQVHEDDVAELLLGVVGDADLGLRTVDAKPLVVFRGT